MTGRIRAVAVVCLALGMGGCGDDGGVVDTDAGSDAGVEDDGALYVLEYGTSYFGDNEDARLSRIEHSAEGALPPVADIAASPRAGAAPLEVSFSAEGSRAAGTGDAIAEWEWDLDGDGAVGATGPTVAHTYEDNGVYQPTVVVVGTSGRRSLPMAVPIVVGNTPPDVRITSPADGTVVGNGAGVELAGEVTDAEDGTIACDQWQWNILLGHNAHSHPYEVLDGCETSFTARLDADEPGTHFFVVELVYRDSGGPGGLPALTGRDGVEVYVSE